MKKLGILALSIISIFLIILLSFSFTLNSFLYPEIYFEALEASGVYNSIQNSVGSQELFFIVMPEEDPKGLVEDLFTKFMAYLRSETNSLELKVQIDQEKLRNFFIGQIGQLQQCTGNQDPFNDENPCLPRGMNVELYLDSYLKSKNLDFFNETEVDLVDIYGIQEGSEGRIAIDNLREKISYLKIAYLLSIIFLIISISLIFLIQKPNYKKFLRNLGFIAIIPSAVIYLTIRSLGELRNQGIFPVSDMFMLSIYNTVTEVLSSRLMDCVIILLIIGIGSIIFYFILKNKDKSKKL